MLYNNDTINGKLAEKQGRKAKGLKFQRGAMTAWLP